MSALLVLVRPRCLGLGVLDSLVHVEDLLRVLLIAVIESCSVEYGRHVPFVLRIFVGVGVAHHGSSNCDCHLQKTPLLLFLLYLF